MHQYFRCLAYEVKIGSGTLSVGANEERKPFTIIEGFSRNEDFKKRSLMKARNISPGWNRPGGSRSLPSREGELKFLSDPKKKRKT